MLFQYEAELDAFLEFLIWRFSIWVDKPTPGIALMNLRYRDERALQARGKGELWMHGLCILFPSSRGFLCCLSVGIFHLIATSLIFFLSK